LAATLRESVDQIIEVVDVPRDHDWPFLTENLDLGSDFDDSDIDLQEQADEQLHWEAEQADSTPSSHTVGKPTPESAESTDSPMLPTPEETPEPSSSRTLESDPSPTPDPTPAKNKKKAPTRPIIGDLSETNIVDGPRRRTPTDQRVVHFAALNTAFAAAAFATGIQFEREQAKHLHRDQLPPPPKHWKEMLEHPYKDGFLAAANKGIYES